jgi:predicted nucleic acid-binding protein
VKKPTDADHAHSAARPAGRLSGNGGLRVLFDASALTKRYAFESGRDRVLVLFGEAGELLVAVHCQSEVASALLRRRREGHLPIGEFDRVWEAAQRDVADMVCIPLDRQVERFTFAAMEYGSLPTMDALHVGSALAADVDLFVTADRRQAKVARGLGLQTECLVTEPHISQMKFLT